MTESTRIPKKVEEVLVTHRRGFLRSAGLLVVSDVEFIGHQLAE